jgi:DNA-binding transcriptional regulator YiaG
MNTKLRPLAKAVNPAFSSAEQGYHLGHVFRDARRNCGYSTDTIADALGITERTVRRWQSGEAPVDLLLLLQRAPDVGQIVAAAATRQRAA